MKTEKQKTIVLALLILVLNFILKGIYLSANSIGWDEPFSIYHAQLNIDQLITIYSQGNNPPLYEIILHFWIKAFGISEFAVRFPSLIFSSVTAVVIFLIAKRHFNFSIALTAALLFTFSNYQIFFAHEARAYALFGMLSALSLYTFMNIYAEENFNRKQLFILLLINSLIIYTHYFGFFIILFQSIYIFSITQLRTKIWKNYLLYLFLLVLAYSPNLSVLLNRFMQSAVQGTWIQPPNHLDELYEMLRQFTNAPVVTVSCIILMISALVLAIKNRNSLSNLALHKIILLSFFLPFIFMFVLSYWIPMFIDRYLIFVTAPLYITLAICADFLLKNTKLNFALHLTIISMFIITCKPNMDNKRHVEETINKITELKKEKTLVIFCPQSFVFNFAYYYDSSIFQLTDKVEPYQNMNTALLEQNVVGINNISEINLINWNHVIYLDAGADFLYSKNNILENLNSHYLLTKKYEFEEIFKVFDFSMKN